MLLEYIAGGEPATDLGAAEAAWRGGLASVSDQLGIVELGDVCAAMRAHSLDLFGSSARVTTTAPGELQRLFAEACHRHAWHAELWELCTPRSR